MREEILKIGKLPIPEKIKILEEIKSKLHAGNYRTEYICLIMDDINGLFTETREHKYLLGRFGLLNGLHHCNGCWSLNSIPSFQPIADRDMYAPKDMINWKKTIVQFAIDLLNVKYYNNNH